MSDSNNSNLHVHIDGPVARVTIDRPEKKNAMSPSQHAAMHEALDRIEAAGGVKVVVLTGVGDVFCGGMDLETYFLEAYPEPERFRGNLRSSHSWMRRWKAFDAVTVAAVNGWCVGGGLLMAAISDIVITADEAQFSLSEVNFGIFPSGGTTWAMARNMPAKQALYYMLTAERFAGPRAVELGLATRSVPREQLNAVVSELCTTLANKDREALRYTKLVYERVRDMNYADAQQFEVAMLFDLSYQTDNKWINQALEQFRKRSYRPALESFEDESK